MSGNNMNREDIRNMMCEMTEKMFSSMAADEN